MPNNRSVTEDGKPRRLRRVESFTILFMVALGWTCSSSHGGGGSSGDDEDVHDLYDLFDVPKSAETVVDAAPAEDE